MQCTILAAITDRRGEAIYPDRATVMPAPPIPPQATSGPAEPWLRHVPVPLFAVGMGLTGLGLAWRQAGDALDWPAEIGGAILILAAAGFVAIGSLYAAKMVAHADAVLAEFRHPVRVNFFPAASVSLLLLAAAALPYSEMGAMLLWATGAVVHLILAIVIFRRWIVHNIEITQASPAWFIPVVGTIMVPIAGAPLGYTELSWFFFAVGLVFWSVLFPIVLNRIIFHDQLPGRFLPTLFILIAPPAIGFVAYAALTEAPLDGLGRVLLFAALFIALLLASMGRLFLTVPFSVAWWAYTFPSAALAAAAVTYHHSIAAPATALLAATLLILATVIIGLVAVRTMLAILSGRLFQPDP